MAIDNNADFTPSIPDSSVTPTKSPYNPTGSFKFWAQKVIPLVYDDSLSYYEVLCKVVNYLNNVIQNVDNLNDSVNSTNQSFETLKGYVNTTKDTLINTYNELQSYVNTYFDNLDVQEEINEKLDEMADSGELSNLLAPFIPDLVTAWLNSHVTPTSPVVDNTLSISGAAADAKVTGDLKSAVNANEYDPNSNYSAFDIVWHNNNLYRAKIDITAENWTAGHWNKINIADYLLFTIKEICKPYDNTAAYAVGDYCRASISNSIHIYRCRIAIPEGGENWTSGHWVDVTTGIATDLGKRIESNKTLLNTLGTTVGDIETEISGMQEAISNIEIDEISSGGVFPSKFFAVGGINTNGNYVQNITYRVATPNKFQVKNDMVISVDDGFIVTLWLYPSGESPTRQIGSGFVIPKNTDAMIVVRRETEDTAEIANVDVFSSALLLKLNDTDEKIIIDKSFGVNNERYQNIVYTDLLTSIPSLDVRTSRNIWIDRDVVFQNKPFSIGMGTSAGTSSEIRFTIPSAIQLAGTQEFEMCVYVEDATNITGMTLRTLTGGFVKNNPEPIKTGWNKFRFYTEGAGTLTYDADITTFRLTVSHSAETATKLYIGSLVQVKPQYANLIIIADGPYYTFYTEAYPTLKTNGVPVCWAVDGGLLDDENETDRKLINETELELLGMDGLSEFSFHSYDLTDMSSATEDEALSDTLKCIRFLKKRGLEPEKIWRAAWLQNSCANPELANLEVDASCSYNGAAGVSMYPFGSTQYNIPRISLQGRTTDYFDELFTKLKNHHCTVFVYTHGISEDSGKNMTHTMLNYFISKIETGVSEGWLNPTTYNRLVNYYKKIK